MNLTSFKDFKKLASMGNLVPVIAQVSADTETPISAFLKMTQGPYRFLLESMEGGERWGRYSFLGSEPAMVLRSRGKQIELQEGRKVQHLVGDPLELIRNILKQYQPVEVPGLPRFAGGWVGYLSYDLVRLMERLPDLGKASLPSWDAYLMLQKDLVAFDNLLHQVQVVVLADLLSAGSVKKAYEQAQKRVEALLLRLKSSLPKRIPKIRRPQHARVLKPRSNTSEAEFHEMVRRSVSYIKAGDIFQVVPSQRWELNFSGDPFQVYRELRQLNPSPYLFYLSLGDQVLTGSSPEVMVRLEEDKITLRPIAGTRRRGRDEADEVKMQQEMMGDPKEIAEHIMLLDLGRNDVGRVAKTGTVKVTEQLAVEKYSHVMHIVSNVEGKKLKSKDAVDVLKATFPAGTLTGAPKIRAMEIIEELEKEKRGPYGGGVGYLDFFGNMDTAITIRSLFFAKGKAWFQSGGGVVLDSKPKLEYLESQNKARAVLEALKRCY